MWFTTKVATNTPFLFVLDLEMFNLSIQWSRKEVLLRDDKRTILTLDAEKMFHSSQIMQILMFLCGFLHQHYSNIFMSMPRYESVAKIKH